MDSSLHRLSMGFSRQEYESGLPFPSPGHRPKPGIEPRSPALQTDALPSEIAEKDNQTKISDTIRGQKDMLMQKYLIFPRV